MCWDPVCDASGVGTMVPAGESAGDPAGVGGGGGLALASGNEAAAGGGWAAAAIGAKVAVPPMVPDEGGIPNGEERTPGRAKRASSDLGSGDGTLLLATAADVSEGRRPCISLTKRRSLRTRSRASARLVCSVLETSSLSAICC